METSGWVVQAEQFQSSVNWGFCWNRELKDSVLGNPIRVTFGSGKNRLIWSRWVYQRDTWLYTWVRRRMTRVELWCLWYTLIILCLLNCWGRQRWFMSIIIRVGSKYHVGYPNLRTLNQESPPRSVVGTAVESGDEGRVVFWEGYSDLCMQ